MTVFPLPVGSHAKPTRGAQSPFGAVYGAWLRRKKRLRGDIEILPLVRAGGPHRVVVVPESKVQSELVIHLPVVLDIEIPVGIAVANKSWESDFLQNENIIVYEVGNAGVVVGLLRPQPFVVPVDANLRAKFKSVAPDRLAYIVKNLEIGKRSDLIEEYSVRAANPGP